MNSRWIRSNEILLTFFVMAVVLVGVLAFLVRQQHDLAIDGIDGQVFGQTVPVASAPPHASTLASAPTLSQSGISERAPAQPNAAVVDVPSQGSTSHPAQTPSKEDTSAPVQDQHGAAVVNSPSHSNAPQPANTPSKLDVWEPELGLPQATC